MVAFASSERGGGGGSSGAGRFVWPFVRWRGGDEEEGR